MQFQSSPQQIKLPLPTNRQPVDETQTDLESGFNPKKKPKNTEEEWVDEDLAVNTFQGLSSITEHKYQEQLRVENANPNLTEESKKTIMKKLIEIMDESHINDD